LFGSTKLIRFKIEPAQTLVKNDTLQLVCQFPRDTSELMRAISTTFRGDAVGIYYHMLPNDVIDIMIPDGADFWKRKISPYIRKEMIQNDWQAFFVIHNGKLHVPEDRCTDPRDDYVD